MLSTIGFIALLLGAVLLVVGYIAEPRAIRPGWVCVVVGVVLVLLAYVLPALHTDAVYDTADSDMVVPLMPLGLKTGNAGHATTLPLSA